MSSEQSPPEEPVAVRKINELYSEIDISDPSDRSTDSHNPSPEHPTNADNMGKTDSSVGSNETHSDADNTEQ